MNTTTKPTIVSLGAQVEALTATVQLLADMVTKTIIAQAAAPAPAPRAELEGLSNCLGNRTYSRPIVAIFGSDAEAFDFQKAQGVQASTGKLLAVAMPVWWTPGSKFPQQIKPLPTHACNLVAVY